ncbi:MAG: hypothetical protein J0M35_17315 [Candidatus Obscuribacter phosphatis]|uniref:Uncharacterized protein n=1 Tax=Candidatus Obscuribacter phosphatis TaxID=1906157 RepID=A0A8J7PA17_9BACT|nr:hypothetical protein [Candidatus Obscuribacter phosphatis]
MTCGVYDYSAGACTTAQKPTILIGCLEFEGPFDRPWDIAEKRGVYAVLCLTDGLYELLDIGFSENLRASLLNHPDQDDWLDEFCGSLVAAVLYSDEMTDDEATLLIDSIERELSQNEF